MTTNKAQFELTFQAGLTDEFQRYIDVLRASVYDCGRQFKIVAADVDLTSSGLSRRLADSADKDVHFAVEDLPVLLAATGDLRPIYWLIEKFLDDPDAKRKRTLSQLETMLPQLERLLRGAQS